MITLLDRVPASRMVVTQALLLQSEADLIVNRGSDCWLEIYEGPLDALVDPLLQLRVKATVLLVNLLLQVPVTKFVLMVDSLLLLLLVLLQGAVLRHVKVVLHWGIHPFCRDRRC